MAADNPFTAVLEKYWELLIADTRFAALVKKGNRVSRSELIADTLPTWNASTSDFPWVETFMDVGNTPGRTSNSQHYQFVIHTDIYSGSNYQDTAARLVWICKQVVESNVASFTALEYNSTTFCVDVKVDSYGIVGMVVDQSKSRTQSGWAARVDLLVTLSFAETLLASGV